MLCKPCVALLPLSLVVTLSCGDGGPTTPRQTGWQHLGLDGIKVTMMELDWPHLYAGGHPQGLFRAKLTSDNPEWKYLGFADEWLEDITAVDRGIILAANPSGLYRSVDGGFTWVESDSGISHCDGEYCWVTCFSSTEDVIFAGTEQRGLYMSDDQGLSWTLISHDSGLTHWEIECHPGKSGFMLTRVYTAREEEELFVSHDRGRSWEWVPYSARYYRRGILSLAIDPTLSGTAYVGFSGAVLKTDDGGDSWTPILEPQEKPGFTAMAHDPMRRGHIFMAGNLSLKETGAWSVSLYESLNGGNTVDLVDHPIEEPIWDLLYDSRRNVLFVAASDGVYKYVQ